MKFSFLLVKRSQGKGRLEWEFYPQTKVHHPHDLPNNRLPGFEMFHIFQLKINIQIKFTFITNICFRSILINGTQASYQPDFNLFHYHFHIQNICFTGIEIACQITNQKLKRTKFERIRIIQSISSDIMKLNQKLVTGYYRKISKHLQIK